MDEIEILFREPISLIQVANLWGCDTREARKRISALQEAKYNIVNLQDGKGYFIATGKDFERYRRQETSRANKITKKLIVMERRNEISQGKCVITVREHTRHIGKKDDVDGQIKMI